MPVLGPAVEAHFGHGLRFDPGRGGIERRLRGEGAARSLQSVQAFLDLRKRALAETRADMRGVAELPLVPVADEQRAERRARTLAPGIAADDKVGAPCRLDLHP